MATNDKIDPISQAVGYIRSRVPRTPDIGIVCGSGLAGLYKIVTDPVVIQYNDIPGYLHSTVDGHKNELVFGELGDKYVMLMRGRFHFYEGYHPAQVTIGIRVMAALGTKAVVVTNAAGTVNNEMKVGNVMIIEDHIFLPGIAGNHPLVGPNDERFGSRFPAVANAYDKGFAKIVKSCAEELNLSSELQTGVYACVSGPSYESPHEVQALNRLGADAVGMSTAAEVVVAAHCGMRVLGLSLITNICLCPGDTTTPIPTHEEVLAATTERTRDVEALVSKTVQKMDVSSLPRPRAFASFANVKYEASASSKAICHTNKCSATGKCPCPFRDVGLVAVAAAVGAATAVLVMKQTRR